MEGIEGIEAAHAEPDESQTADPISYDGVPDSDLPTSGEDDQPAPEDAVTTHPEDDDPLSNVGDPVE